VSIFEPHSDPAQRIETLFWWMLVAAVVVFVGAVALIGIGFVLRGRKGIPVVGESERFTRGIVVLFGIAVPIVALIAVFTIANFAVAAHTDAPDPAKTRLTVDVVGRQWWWEIRYPATRNAVTANELHIPVRTHVDVRVSTADVIHSFWVPQLNRKIDTIPGKRNRVELYADAPGRYQGQCAEYCGLQHAHMRLIVIAEPMERFRAWLRRTSAPAAAPRSAAAQRGRQVFERNACASCHQIRGTSAQGRVGPDLTHLQERSSLAALTIPNTRRELSRWIREPQHVKPGNRMPGLHLSRGDFDDIVAYLETLR
jgi:cytochrome c oxidase subunit 2